MKGSIWFRDFDVILYSALVSTLVSQALLLNTVGFSDILQKKPWKPKPNNLMPKGEKGRKI